MKQFNKTLLAAALMVAAGSANASIAWGNNTAAEAYLSVYDSSQALTFVLDLGLTMGDLVTNISNTAFSKSYDLNALTDTSTGGQWSDFAAGLNTATTVFGLVTSGTSGKLMATGPAISPAKFATTPLAIAAVTQTKNHILVVNTAARADTAGLTSSADTTALNLSAIISDADTANTGQHNQLNPFATLNGGKTDAGASINYGTEGNFYYYSGAAIPVLAAQTWNLNADTGMLTYAVPVAAVPLPAAVWMFGAGLMGLLRLNRRKSMAV
ncbi:MAG: VPLPA-CTERM sorting domain-containing protein [Methylococcaceae bacterium]